MAGTTTPVVHPVGGNAELKLLADIPKSMLGKTVLMEEVDMKIIPRVVFWLGTVSLCFGIILKLIWGISGRVAGPFGTGPYSYWAFAVVCFLGAIAYCQVFVLTRPKE